MIQFTAPRAKMRIALAVLSFLAAAAAFAQANVPVQLLDWRTPVPASWKSQPPSSNMRLTQFIAPAKSGDAEVVVFYFGPRGAGSLEANIERWASQFTENGKPVKPLVTKGKAGGMAVTHVELNGDYARSMGSGQLGKIEPNQTLRVAVLETPKGPITFQIWGARDSVAAHAKGFRAMVEGLKPAR
jgi:hypothetical protein